MLHRDPDHIPKQAMDWINMAVPSKLYGGAQLDDAKKIGKTQNEIK